MRVTHIWSGLCRAEREMARLTFPTSPRRLPGLVDDYLAGKLTVDDYVTHRVRLVLSRTVLRRRNSLTVVTTFPNRRRSTRLTKGSILCTKEAASDALSTCGRSWRRRQASRDLRRRIRGRRRQGGAVKEYKGSSFVRGRLNLGLCVAMRALRGSPAALPAFVDGEPSWQRPRAARLPLESFITELSVART